MKLQNNFVLLLVALSFTFTYTNAEFRVGGSSSSSSVNTENKSDDKPYMVEIYKNGIFACLGSLVTLEHVVTAIECLREKNEIITIKAGVYSKAKEVQTKTWSGTFCRPNEMNDVYIAIIEVNPAFDGNSGVEKIELCNTELKEGTPMQVNGNLIPSTVVTLPGRSFCTRYSDNRGLEKIFGYVVEGKVDSGAPGVVGGTLCAVATSYFNSPIYADLSKGSNSFNFIKKITTKPYRIE